MKTLEIESWFICQQEIPGPDLEYFRPTCELKWEKNNKDTIVLLQKYECRFPEKSLDPIWFPVRFVE